jgi:hypothetical protein
MQQFASAPQAVRSHEKYRDDMDGTQKNNIMHDRRVVRGSTYASLAAPQEDMAEVQKQREAQRRRLMRANQTKKRVGTPEPIPGRKHMDIQTDSYLEELTERTVEFEAETQTDFLLDRPPSPLFMPAKIGVDIDTQIEEGDLFDFDVEVEPVLEVLVGKTLEQSMMEVLEEEELESLRRHQEEFEKKRNTEMLEVQRMEAAEKRRSDEMERRMHQAQAQRDQDISVMKKVISRSIAASHLSSLKDRALAHLLDAGVFANSIEGAVDSRFVPDLLKQVSSQMQTAAKDRQAVQAVLKSSIQSKLDKHSNVLKAERERKAAIDAAEKEARIERNKERLRQEGERQRILKEQEAMIAWEQYQPPPPPEVSIASLTTEEPIKAVTTDGKEYPVIAEKLPDLTALLESLTGLDPPKIVVASLLDDSTEGSPTYPQYVDDFRLADKPEADPPIDDAAADAAADATAVDS